MRPEAGRSGPWLFVLGALLTAALAWPLAVSRAEDPRDRPYPHGDYQEDCNLCHRDERWLPAEPTKDFVHSKRFPLQGAHRTVRCGACHVSLEFKRARMECVSCHQDIHRGEMGTDCGRCHSPRSFIDRSAALRTHRTTRFPLSGAHAAADCEACHRSRSLGHMMYVGLPVDCAGCHDSTAYPAAPQRPSSGPLDHGALGFTGDCSGCHNTVTFSDARGAHLASAFPLTGAHAIPCSSCHGDPFRRITSAACDNCHHDRFVATADPKHSQAGFGTDCSLCHTPTAWTNANWNHSTETSFPLTGRHAGQDCNACHSSGVFRGRSSACSSCHIERYNGTTDPNHAQAFFPTDCSLCHTPAGWEGATFNHSGTGFPLAGSHLGLNCNACHGDGVYRGRSTACVSCHLANYNATTDPNHAQAGFPTDCALCHNTTSFAGATFNHSATAFPLTGSHAGLLCSACHSDGVYKGKPTACYSCHRTAYENVADPNHRAAGFSTECNLCHNTTSFAGARFAQHDGAYFPIYSGTHAREWTHCADCHTNSGSYAAFSCFSCHPQQDTSSMHVDVVGFEYVSSACYSCHPSGSAK